VTAPNRFILPDRSPMLTAGTLAMAWSIGLVVEAAVTSDVFETVPMPIVFVFAALGFLPMWVGAAAGHAPFRAAAEVWWVGELSRIVAACVALFVAVTLAFAVLGAPPLMFGLLLLPSLLPSAAAAYLVTLACEPYRRILERQGEATGATLT
jgi:alkylation response protein AidB-like acyl-CoA dehydrogenase